eukprot:g19332.t1
MGKAEELQQAMEQLLQELEASHAAPQRNKALEIALVTFGANVKVWEFELSQLKKCHLLRGDEAKKEAHDAGDSRLEKALFGGVASKGNSGKGNSGSSFFAECWSSGSSSGRIVLLTRGPCTVGPGRVAALECGAFGIGEFAEEKGNSANSPRIPKTPEVPDHAFSDALAFYNTELKKASVWSGSAHQITYDVLALGSVHAGQQQDAGQAVGLDVLRGLCDKTGGMLAILQHASGVVRTVPRLLGCGSHHSVSGSCKIEVLTTQCGAGGTTLGSAYEFTGLLNAPKIASCAGGGDQPDVEAMVAAVAKIAVERLLESQARPKSLSHLGGLLVQRHYAYQLDDKKRTERETVENEHQNSTSSFDWLSGFAASVLKENATFELGVPVSFRLHHNNWRLLPAFCCFLQRKLQLLVGDIKGGVRHREDQDAAWLSAVRREAVPNVLLLLKPTLLRFEVLLCGSHHKKAPPPRAVPLSNLVQLSPSVRVPEQESGAGVVEESETSLHCHVLDSFSELRICRSAGLRSGFWSSGSGRSGSNNIKAATGLLANVRESVEVIVEQRVPTPAVVEVVREDTLLADEDFEAGAIAGVSAFENELVRGIVQGK